MADIEIVIKLSEKDCEHLKRLGALWVESEKGSSIVSKALLDGIILPKGHGRLIDADKLWDSYHDLDYDFYEAFDLADTIIEAEREG